jgi:hypothetical protein
MITGGSRYPVIRKPPLIIGDVVSPPLPVTGGMKPSHPAAQDSINLFPDFNDARLEQWYTCHQKVCFNGVQNQKTIMCFMYI